MVYQLIESYALKRKGSGIKQHFQFEIETHPFPSVHKGSVNKYLERNLYIN